MKKTSGKRAEKGILFLNQEIKGGRKSQERLAFLFQGFFSPGKSGGGGKQEKKNQKNPEIWGKTLFNDNGP